MPRTMRIHSATDVYHVCNRGVQKRRIFDDDIDRKRFVTYMRQSLEGLDGCILAWCLMGNRFHLVVQMEFEELAAFMSRLTSAYATYYNLRHNRSGYLFQGRYKSQPIEDEAYLICAVTYVHQNPAKANICPANQYRWSSYAEYVGTPDLVDVELVLGAFGSRDAFVRQHETPVQDDKLLDVDNGWRMSESESLKVARKLVGEHELAQVKEYPRRRRDAVVERLLQANISAGVISKMTGISKSTVARIAKK